MDSLKAIEFCRSRGNPLDQYRVRYLFENFVDDNEAVKLLEADEIPGGGFPYEFKKGHPLSLSETSLRFGTMIELGLLDNPLTIRNAHLLMSLQQEDGSWDENPELKKIENLPHPYNPGIISTRTWLTGEIVRLLARIVGIEHECIVKGCHFMLSQFDGEKIAGYRIASFLALAVMSWSCRENEKIASALLAKVTEWAKIEKDISFLNWYVECLVDYGLMAQDPLMESLFDRIDAAQHSDGHWGDDDWPEYDVHLTIQSLKHLIWAGKLETVI
jgi:hypothetical protein